MCLMFNCYQMAWKISIVRSRYVRKGNVKNSNGNGAQRMTQIVAAGNIAAIVIFQITEYSWHTYMIYIYTLYFMIYII